MNKEQNRNRGTEMECRINRGKRTDFPSFIIAQRMKGLFKTHHSETKSQGRRRKAEVEGEMEKWRK